MDSAALDEIPITVIRTTGLHTHWWNDSLQAYMGMLEVEPMGYPHIIGRCNECDTAFAARSEYRTLQSVE